MSRHKLVKAIDIDDELDDFDGGVSDYDEEVGAEDKGTSNLLSKMVEVLKFYVEQLRIGTIKVREFLGDDVPVTNKEIEDSLWHYYYDVDKTVNYLLSENS